jgi:hypothetical protein
MSMGLFGWFEKKEVPPDIMLLHREMKKLTLRIEKLESENKQLRQRDEALRKAINSVGHHAHTHDSMGRSDSYDARSLYERVFGKGNGGW